MDVTFRLNEQQVPDITIDGESVGVVSCSYQYFTGNSSNRGVNLITATVLSGYDADTGPTQSVVYHNILTDETYLQ